MRNSSLAENLRAKTDELISNAMVDSHEPIDYNPGKQMFARFKVLFLGPIMRQMGMSTPGVEKRTTSRKGLKGF